MNLFQMNAIHGDGSVNWYCGTATPKVREVVQQLNDNIGSGIIEIDPNDEDTGFPALVSPDEVCLIEDEQELINTLAWWCNGCPDAGDSYEFLPAYAQRHAG